MAGGRGSALLSAALLSVLAGAAREGKQRGKAEGKGRGIRPGADLLAGNVEVDTKVKYGGAACSVRAGEGEAESCVCEGDDRWGCE